MSWGEFFWGFSSPSILTSPAPPKKKIQALREKGALKLQVVGTKGAEQAFLALRNLKQVPYLWFSEWLYPLWN